MEQVERGSPCGIGGAGRCEGSLCSLGGRWGPSRAASDCELPLTDLYPLGTYPEPITECLSPFNRLTGDASCYSPGPLSAQRRNDARQAACGPATNDREHIVEALGIGAVLLAGLSFLPRRRALATGRRLEPSPV